jgi:hypothetical protein
MAHPLVVHCKRSPHDVYVGRPGPFGNPFPLSKGASLDERLACVERFRAYVMTQPELLARIRRELRGKTLGCWCAPQACHGDVLAEIANQ